MRASLCVTIFFFVVVTISAAAKPVKTASGSVEGTTTSDGKVQVFLGIPYAEPPVGALRWKEPQPVKPWKDVRKATQFGNHCMQGKIFGDMVFPDPGQSEDCLTLNVWTPKADSKLKLPVMLWIYGGGFQAGATSEPRQNGEFLAHKDVVVVSMNYRLGIFGFFAHPELSKESPHFASGNYGLMDQAAALQWVKKNIAAFGGDPANITIFGESAGSFSVSAQMASPLSRGLIAQAIGESGAFFDRNPRDKKLSESEADGLQFAKDVGADSLAKLRAMPAQQLLDAVMKSNPFRFWPNIDGYFLTDRVDKIFAKGEQAHVPLLAGWNRDEGSWQGFFGTQPPTKENYVAKIKKDYGDHADEILKLFPAETDEQMKESAGLLSTAEFIGYGTWKWIEAQSQAGDLPVYRFEFDQAPPVDPKSPFAAAGPKAYHSAEIEYVFGTLKSKDLPFTADDYKVSELMQNYWTNFARTGNPNGGGLPQWPRYDAQQKYVVMHLKPNPEAIPDEHREQYLTIEKTIPQNPQTSAIRYPNTSEGLYFFLESILSEAHRGDIPKLKQLIKETEIPTSQFPSMALSDEANGSFEAYGKDLAAKEKAFQELFLDISIAGGEIHVRKVKDAPKLDSPVEQAVLRSPRKRWDLYYASWGPPSSYEASSKPVGYFMFIDGGFRWDSTIHFPKPPVRKPVSTEAVVFTDCPGVNEPISGLIYTVGNGVEAPKIIKAPDPEYSELARNDKVEGIINLKCVVDINGCAKRIEITKSLGHGLDEKAIEAVREWRFQPATKDGRPVAAQLAVEVDFRLY